MSWDCHAGNPCEYFHPRATKQDPMIRRNQRLRLKGACMSLDPTTLALKGAQNQPTHTEELKLLKSAHKLEYSMELDGCFEYSSWYTQEEGIDYDEVFTLVARIEAIRLFLAYASFKDFVVYQMDVKSAFLYGKIKEEVYVCQPPGFEDPDFPDRVYKVEKTLCGLHQAPRAWYETLSTYLLDNGFQRGNIDMTLFIRRDKGDILLVQVYVDDIIFGFTKKLLCTEFEKMMNKKFQMSSMGELTFFLGLQDEDGEEVDVHLYRSMIGSLKYLTSSRPDIMFAVCACAKYQVNPKVSHLHACKKQTVVANSTTKAEYVAASSCCGQVKMDDSNITIEEYIRLEEEKTRRHAEFSAIVFNDTLTSEVALSCEPTVSSLNNDEIVFRISFDESEDEDCTVIFDKNSFSYKIIYVNNLKTDSENDNDNINMPLLPSPKPTVSYFDDLDFFKDFENEFPAIVYNDDQTSKSDLLTEPILNPQHIDEFNLKDETSLSKYDEKEQNVLNFNDLFPFNVIYPNDAKPGTDNDNDKVDIEHSLGELSVKLLPDVINTDDGAYANESNKLLEKCHDRSNEFFKTEIFVKKLNVNIVACNYLNKGMPFIFLIKNFACRETTRNVFSILIESVFPDCLYDVSKPHGYGVLPSGRYPVLIFSTVYTAYSSNEYGVYVTGPHERNIDEYWWRIYKSRNLDVLES
ncbi:putative ribonuclease H-like domain-containing protein [Tanacetum coccineum]